MADTPNSGNKGILRISLLLRQEKADQFFSPLRKE